VAILGGLIAKRFALTLSRGEQDIAVALWASASASAREVSRNIARGIVALTPPPSAETEAQVSKPENPPDEFPSSGWNPRQTELFLEEGIPLLLALAECAVGSATLKQIPDDAFRLAPDKEPG
jgi:hypothetical protein